MSRTHRSHAQWLELFEAFEQSGQTQAAFCTERDLNPAYFSKRRRELLEQNDNGFVQA
ncbi:MAG: IS66 family insertion sequence element accessory protein TnpA, partial [Pseudoalteromonas marina]